MGQIRKILIFVLALVLSGTAMSQENEISFKSTELAPGLYMLEGQGGFAGGNIGLLTGDDGVVVIDGGLEPLTAVTITAIEAITGEPLDFLINTHAHGDHVGGNAALREKGASIVAHEKLRDRMVADDAARDALPELTYTGEVTFHLNGHTARVFHVANAHTDGDSAIHFPEVNVIHAGDALFNRLFPFIDLDSGGSVSGFIAAQEKILAMANNQTKIIAGHGELANKADLQVALDMLIDSRARVKALVDAGKSKDEIIAENPLADYHDVWNWGFITTERMTEMLYRSLTSE